MSDDQELSVEQNNDIVSLSSIDEDNSRSYEDIDKDFSKNDETNNEDDETNNEDEKLQYNKTYDLTEALLLEHYEETDSDTNGNNEHSSTHQSLDEDSDQQDNKTNY